MDSQTVPIRKAPRVSAARLMQLARPEWKPLALGTFFLALASVTNMAFPQEMRKVIDDAVAAHSTARVDRAALWLVAIFAVQGIAMASRYVLYTTSGERIVARLREQLYASVLRQEVAFFDQMRTGDLLNHLGADTAVLQNAVSVNISMALRNAASVIGGLSMLVYTSPVLTLLMLGVVPPVAIGAMAQGRRVRKLSRDVQDALAGASDVAEESIAGIRTVRAFSAEAVEAKRYGAAVQQSFRTARSRILTAGLFMGWASFFGYGAIAVVLWYGGRLVVAGALTAGALTSFIVYTVMVAVGLAQMSDLWAELMKATGAAERVFELLDREPAMASSGGVTLPEVKGSVRFDSVHFAYPTRPDAPVLRGVDVSMRAGEIVALVGPSGAGKSTVAGLLSRLYDPDAGHIDLDGHDLRDLDPEWLRRQVGVVSQEPTLFSGTVADNIRYARPDATDEEVEQAARAANAHEFVARFPQGYKTPVGERGVQLSGGQKQRVAIARAVLKNPRLLVLDEATSALDAESEHLVKDALDHLMRGRTTLIIAHRLSTVVDADRVLVIDGGQVVQSGNHRALMGEDGLYKRLIERQFVAA